MKLSESSETKACFWLSGFVHLGRFDLYQLQTGELNSSRATAKLPVGVCDFAPTPSVFDDKPEAFLKEQTVERSISSGSLLQA